MYEVTLFRLDFGHRTVILLYLDRQHRLLLRNDCQPLPPLTSALSQARVPGWEMDAGLGGKTTLSNSTQPSSPAPKLVPKCRKAFVFRDFDAPKSRRRTDGDPLDNCPMAKVEPQLDFCPFCMPSEGGSHQQEGTPCW